MLSDYNFENIMHMMKVVFLEPGEVLFKKKLSRDTIAIIKEGEILVHTALHGK